MTKQLVIARVVEKIRILVTGAGGFIGSYLAQTWQKNPEYKIISAVRNKPLPNFAGTTLTADLAEGIPLDYPVDAIVHCAAQSPAPGITVMDCLRSNVMAVNNLVGYARRYQVNKFIYLSSVSVYGQISDAVIDENTSIVNPEPYGLSKYLGEMLLAEQKDWLPAIAIRLPGVLGTGAKTPWLARTAQSLLRGEEIEIFNPKAYFNNMVHVADLARFIEFLLSRQIEGYEVLTLACKEGLSVEDTVLTLKQQLGSSSPVKICPAVSQAFSISIEKARMEGYAPMSGRELLQTYAYELMQHLST